jgi:hypothetical protein
MAGSTGVTVRVISDRLPQVPAQVRALLSQEVVKAAFAIQAKAQALAPVKTGLLRRSIHTVIAANGQSATVGPSVLYDKFVELGHQKDGGAPLHAAGGRAGAAEVRGRRQARMAGLK